MSDAKPSYGALIAVGVITLGIFGTILLLSRRTTQAASRVMVVGGDTEYTPSPYTGTSGGNIHYEPSVGSGKSAMTYENEERVSFPKGFDPDTLMPYEIVVHRTAVVRR